MTAIDWRQKIQVGDATTTLEAWLAENYLHRSDEEIARILTASGLPCTRQAVRSKRRRVNWLKPPGDSQPGGKITAAEVEAAIEVLPPEETSADVEVVPLREIKPADLLQAIRNRPLSLKELSRQFDRSEDTIAGVLDELKRQHYNIVEVGGRASLDTKAAPGGGKSLPRTLADEAGMKVRLGIASDTHGGSTAQQITNLNRFVDLAYEQGVRHILHEGDLVAGDAVYKGQVHDLFAHGADAQALVVAETLPRREGLTWYVIGGNHDYSFVRAAGYNIVAAIAAGREDVVYLGYDMADVPITDRVEARLWHPTGGVPYALSYRLQKGLEQIAFDELFKAIQSRENPKMRLVLSGHLHVWLTMGRGPIVGLQCGCFEGQTNYLKRKALFPDIGGYILTLWLTDDGLIQRTVYEWVSFLDIEDDYLNYPDLLAKIGEGNGPEMGPMFEWVAEDE